MYACKNLGPNPTNYKVLQTYSGTYTNFCRLLFVEVELVLYENSAKKEWKVSHNRLFGALFTTRTKQRVCKSHVFKKENTIT